MLQDEDVYTFFEPDLPCDGMGIPRSKITDALKAPGDRRSTPKLSSSKSSNAKSSQSRTKPIPNLEKKTPNHASGGGRRSAAENSNASWNVLDLKKENYFSCAVGRKRTNARYVMKTSDDVVAFLRQLAESSTSST